jgi:hypothetical protein
MPFRALARVAGRVRRVAVAAGFLAAAWPLSARESSMSLLKASSIVRSRPAVF